MQKLYYIPPFDKPKYTAPFWIHYGIPYEKNVCVGARLNLKDAEELRLLLNKEGKEPVQAKDNFSLPYGIK